MSVSENESLRSLNTFGLGCTCRALRVFRNEQELVSLLEKAERPVMVLGGGSNLLLPSHLELTVLKNEITGMEVMGRNDDHVWVRVGGGEVWHDLVVWAVEHGFGGIENLALIPGTVGAAPIQNIGAYGVELKDVMEYLEAISLEDGTLRRFMADECDFGYRDSIFKKEEKGRWAIVRVVFRLDSKPSLSLSYGDIAKVLAEQGILAPTIRDVCEAVISIRRSKLPDPAIIGNAGSFFKNPVIGRAAFQQLKRDWPEIPAYPQEDGQVKVPAGWLIEKAGWKGHRRGDCGVHEKQALVLVNYGHATAEELVRLANDIRRDIRERFGVDLEPEVNIL